MADVTPPQNLDTPTAWMAVARLLRPQGRRGELLADPLTDLDDLFAAGREFVLADPKHETTPDPARSPLTLESFFHPTGRNAGRIVLKLSGSDSINDAETLSGRTLLVRASDLPPLDAGTYFVRDLLGCTLFDGDVPVGTIADVEFAMAPDGRTRLEDAAPLLVIERPGADEPALVPFIAAWIEHVDAATKELRMRLPEGLLAEPGERS